MNLDGFQEYIGLKGEKAAVILPELETAGCLKPETDTFFDFPNLQLLANAHCIGIYERALEAAHDRKEKAGFIKRLATIFGEMEKKIDIYEGASSRTKEVQVPESEEAARHGIEKKTLAGVTAVLGKPSETKPPADPDTYEKQSVKERAAKFASSDLTTADSQKDERLSEFFQTIKRENENYLYDEFLAMKKEFSSTPTEPIFTIEDVRKLFRELCPEKMRLQEKYTCSPVNYGSTTGMEKALKKENDIYHYFKNGSKEPNTPPLIVGVNVSKLFVKYFAACYIDGAKSTPNPLPGDDTPLGHAIKNCQKTTYETTPQPGDGNHSIVLTGVKKKHGFCYYRLRDSDGTAVCSNKTLLQEEARAGLHCDETTGDFWINAGTLMQVLGSVEMVAPLTDTHGNAGHGSIGETQAPH